MLEIQNLTIYKKTAKGKQNLLKQVSLSIQQQERVAIVGMSGAGKSVLIRSFIGMLPPGLRVTTESSMTFNGQAQYVKGRYHPVVKPNMGMILQDPMTALNPSMTIFKQLMEATNPKIADKKRQQMVCAVLQDVRLDLGVRNFFPRQISGGMAQRVMVAMMLLLKPDLLIGDEPTSALDAPIGLEVMELILEKVEQQKTTFLFVSHDIDMVQKFCDRVIVMYKGEVVEDLLCADLTKKAQHPHTLSLLEAKNILRGAQ